VLKPGYLSVTGAARFLGVSPQTVRRWCDQFEKNQPGERGLRSERHPKSNFRTVALEDLQAFRASREAHLKPMAGEAPACVPAVDLHYVPQVISELQSTVGQAIAEFMSDSTGTSHEVRANLDTLKRRAEVLLRQAETLIDDLEKNRSLSKDCEAMTAQLGLVRRRLAELVPVVGSAVT
jgi:transposase-like protein